MSGIRSTFLFLALTGLAAAAAPSTASALEAQDVAKSLRALMDSQGVKAQWAGISESGATITLEDFSFTSADTPERVTLGDVTMKDVSEEANHYRVGDISLPSYQQTVDGGFTMRLDDMSASGLILPKDVDADPFGGVVRYDHARIGSATVSHDDKQLFVLDSLDVQMMAPTEKDGTLEFRGTVKKFSADLKAVSKDREKARLDKLGYDTIAGKAEMAGSWRLSDGRLMLSQYEITVNDAGTFSMTLDISGYTPEFARTMREMSEKMQSASDEEKAGQALAMLGLAQQLNFHGTMLRFTDDSLTNKVLDLVAKQRGSSPADLVKQLKALIPLQLTPVLGAELTGRVADAVGRYLDDPQSLEIRAEPESPLSLQVLMGAAMTSPEALSKKLGLKIVANGGQ